MTQDLTPLLARIDALETALASAETTIAAIEANKALLLGPYVTVDTNAINGIAGPNIIFTGANLHIRSGSGSTMGPLNGRGNLVVGYGENEALYDRTGSHNLVVGPNHGWTSLGGFIAGYQNRVSRSSASVSGGANNLADGSCSAVSGGSLNQALGSQSSISGGDQNLALGMSSSVSGGFLNMAVGMQSAVSGGDSNLAFGSTSCVSGGSSNRAEYASSTVSGGFALSTTANLQHLP